jgi:hypothetical protein
MFFSVIWHKEVHGWAIELKPSAYNLATYECDKPINHNNYDLEKQWS